MTPGLAAAGFSGLITICFGREGIIDGGTVCFGDFGGGDPDESAGSGGLGISGGSGGCDGGGGGESEGGNSGNGEKMEEKMGKMFNGRKTVPLW